MSIPHQTQSAQGNATSLANILAYPFRIFFFSAALLATVSIPLWLALLLGKIELPLAMPALFWHQHEMVFGFLSAAIAGFLLTAVCVWTNTDRTHGWQLGALWLVWLLGRLAVTLGGDLPALLVHLINFAFLPLVMLDAGRRIWQARQRKQLMILVVLGLLWAMQIGFSLTYGAHYMAGALVLTLALISIIGGRITPAFSTNWLRQKGLTSALPRQSVRLDQLTLAALILTLAATLLAPAWVTGALALIAAALTLTRLLGWRGWLVRSEPLLWILHISILWVPIALLLYAAHLLWHVPASAWLHAAGLGAMASLILGVMARVCLGHTGRPLMLPGGMVLAFVAIQLGALIRVLTALSWLPWTTGMMLGSLLWGLAFVIFLVRYSRILFSPRADGRPG
ncbi:MAG: NnrS family protein [Marinobacter sp.]|nr:NnrS family protein [Marinobacter sp.]